MATRRDGIAIDAGSSGCHGVGQKNVNILHRLQPDRRSGASNKLFLYRPIQLYLNKAPP